MQNGAMSANKIGLVRTRPSIVTGFTLTETAIVLGVVGIIIGGLWAALSVAQYHVLLNQAVDEIGLIVGNMRSLYASQNASAIVTTPIPVTPAVEQQFVAQGIFPSQMLTTNAGVTYAYNPWDQSAAMGSAQVLLVAAAGNNPAEFIVRYLNILPETCADLLMRNSTPGKDTGLVQIIVTDSTATVTTTYAYSVAAATYQLPVTPIQASQACPVTIPLVASPTYTIDWYYTLGS